MQPAREGLVGMTALPPQIDPALRGILKGLQGITIDRVNRDPLARRHNSHNPIARKGMAALGKVYGHARDQALDRHRVAVAPGLASLGDGDRKSTRLNSSHVRISY